MVNTAGSMVAKPLLLRNLLQVPSPSAQVVSRRTPVSTIVIAVVVSVVATLIIALIAFCIYRERLKRKSLANDERPLAYSVSRLGKLESDQSGLYGGESLPVHAPAANPSLKDNIHSVSKRLLGLQSRPTSKVGSELGDDVKKPNHDLDTILSHAGMTFNPSYSNLYDNNLTEARFSDAARSSLFRYPTMPPFSKMGLDGGAFGTREGGMSGSNDIPVKPSPSPLELDQPRHSSAAVIVPEATQHEVGDFKVAQKSDLKSQASLVLKIRAEFEELGSASATQPQPNHRGQKPKFNNAMDPYPVGWQRNSMGSKHKKPDAPIKSSFISVPTPGPRPLPAPPIGAARPEIVSEIPETALPKLRNYMQQFSANGEDDDSNSGGWSTPTSPLSHELGRDGSIRPSKSVEKTGEGKGSRRWSDNTKASDSFTRGGDLPAKEDSSTPLQTPSPPPPPPPPPPPLPGIKKGLSPSGKSPPFPLTPHPGSQVAVRPHEIKNSELLPPPPPPPPLPGGKNPATPPPPADRPPRNSFPGGRDSILPTSFSEDFPHREPPKQLKPLHWDKVKATPEKDVVWRELNQSFELDPVTLETMFGIQKTGTTKASMKMASFFGKGHEGILDPKKAHNFGIQLRALSLTRNEVCEALLEGEGLSGEILEILVKAAPSEEEKKKLQEFEGDQGRLSPSDRFMYALQSVPNAWLRLESMLYKARYKEELQTVQETLQTLKAACKDLKESRVFRKLLEAVLKTGNRLNMGTFRGDAQAFKLDSLLKLADVKGVDNKTTLLHFVVAEINKSEIARLARLSGNDGDGHVSFKAADSPRSSDFSASMEAAMKMHDDQYAPERMRMGMIMGLPAELSAVSEAGGFDLNLLQQSVHDLAKGLQEIKSQVREGKYTKTEPGTSVRRRSIDLSKDTFQETMEKFIKDAGADVEAAQEELGEALQAVRDTNRYFYGNEAAKNDSDPLKHFRILKQFLIMLEKAWKDVIRDNVKPPSPLLKA